MKGTLELPLNTVLVPNVQQKSDFSVGPHPSAIGHFSNPSNSLRYEFNQLRKQVELGCKTQVVPDLRYASERCKVG